jgi:hypothetical protein
MNLVIRGIDFNLGREPADTFSRNQHPDLRADFTMSSSQNSEGQIRAAMVDAAMVDADVVEVMVALPGQLFFNTQIPACLWFLVKKKSQRKGEVLFIDARKLATMISRVQSEFTDEVIARIAATVAAWRGYSLSLWERAGVRASPPPMRTRTSPASAAASSWPKSPSMATYSGPVRPALCLRLPSDSQLTARHPCRSANSSPCRLSRGLLPPSWCAPPGAQKKTAPIGRRFSGSQGLFRRPVPRALPGSALACSPARPTPHQCAHPAMVNR